MDTRFLKLMLFAFVIFTLGDAYRYRSRRGCGRNRTMCRSVRRCVHNSQLCDGVNNCRDWSDEDACPGYTCPPNKFQCFNGRCINARWQCDNYEDCTDGSDEVGCDARSRPY